MKKEEFISKYGGAAYENRLQRWRIWRTYHRKGEAVRTKEWEKTNPDKVKANDQKSSRKGGKFYNRKQEYRKTGFQGERNKIRNKHGKLYRPYKQLIAPDSELQHEWLPGTAKYRGVALVEKDQHRHGIIDVIQVLEGKITLFTEREIAEQGGVI